MKTAENVRSSSSFFKPSLSFSNKDTLLLQMIFRVQIEKGFCKFSTYTYIASSTHHVISLFLRFLNKKNQFKKYRQTQPPPQDDKNRRNRVSHKKRRENRDCFQAFQSTTTYHLIWLKLQMTLWIILLIKLQYAKSISSN